MSMLAVIVAAPLAATAADAESNVQVCYAARLTGAEDIYKLKSTTLLDCESGKTDLKTLVAGKWRIVSAVPFAVGRTSSEDLIIILQK
ncbi:hypothetical protein [Dyella telluris]|uniref:Uncharacterized protein n=1 Tax=Dyella telluris TaxID=2763498 RepID=A0A7G8Q1R2_9GAMM|nr:hypothetical protein [Dyella telluris]QNK00720.1 hypothetical protein H8F01_16755 [Dyella telluris]